MKKIGQFLLLCIVVGILALFLYISYQQAKIYFEQADTSVPDNVTGEQSISDGKVVVSHNSDWGVATTKEQVLVSSYIPPCDEGFMYCLYYARNTFKGTNFESAGFAMSKKYDLTSSATCINTAPEGFSDRAPKVLQKDGYQTGLFSPIGDAAAGHYASGDVYRLFADSTCYEFQTRIGETQFANYEPGSIKLFTDSNREAVKKQLKDMIDSISLSKGTKVVFPE